MSMLTAPLLNANAIERARTKAITTNLKVWLAGFSVVISAEICESIPVKGLNH